jgi:hypothetical protein
VFQIFGTPIAVFPDTSCSGIVVSFDGYYIKISFDGALIKFQNTWLEVELDERYMKQVIFMARELNVDVAGVC